MTDYPENHRVKWTDNELKKLLKETKNKIDIETIANNHKRTIGSIKFKLFRYAIKLSEEDQSLSLYELSQLTNLNKNELLEGFKKLHYEFPNYHNDNDNDNDKKIKYINFKINSVITFILLCGLNIGIYYYLKL